MKLLLIEDDSELRTRAETALREAGLEVIASGDASSGMALATTERPDIVLLDPMMDGLTGYDVLPELRSRPGLDDIGLIVTSVRAYPADVREAKELGADEYVIKPYEPEQLVAVVRTVLTQRKTTFGVKFWGTRGSIATPGADTVRYGGNTSCVEVRHGNHILIFDCGTGVRELGMDLAKQFRDKHLELHLFVSHTHWDHIQGFPFFQPAYRAGNRINIYSLHSPDRSLEKIFTGQMDSHYFPVSVDDLSARLHFEELESDIHLGDLKVSFMRLNHPGQSLGFRIEAHGKTVVYLTDHEPFHCLLGDSPQARRLDDSIDDFARGADLYIREAQYTDEEYKDKRGWGHSALSQVVESSINSKVKRVVLFHHDPMHDDEQLDSMVEFCRRQVRQTSHKLEVVGAEDKLSVKV